MIYHLLYPLHTLFSIFNVFRYITFRTIYAILTALLISFIIGPWLINKLKDFQIRQVIREDVVENVRKDLEDLGLRAIGLFQSHLPGRSGNIEYFLYMTKLIAES